MAGKSRQVAELGLAVPPPSAYDGQPASGHATGLENWQESACSWLGDRKW